MRQFDCSRLAKVAYHTEKCLVKFLIWPVDDNKKKTLVIYIPFIIFGSRCIRAFGGFIFNLWDSFLVLHKKWWCVCCQSFRPQQRPFRPNRPGQIEEGPHFNLRRSVQKEFYGSAQPFNILIEKIYYGGKPSPLNWKISRILYFFNLHKKRWLHYHKLHCSITFSRSWSFDKFKLNKIS